MKKRITPQAIREDKKSHEDEILELIKIDSRWKEIYGEIEHMAIQYAIKKHQTAGTFTRKLLFYLRKKLTPIEDK